MKPIQIDIVDKRAYAQIAFLVDSPHFQWEIEDIRKEYAVDQMFAYDDYVAWNRHLSQLAGLDDSNAKINKIGQDRLGELEKNFRSRIAAVRELYRYPPIFDDVIKQAVLFNRIDQLKTTQATIYLSPKASIPGTVNQFDATMAILVTPFSTKEEVIQALEECKKLRDEYERYTPVTTTLDRDTLSNITRDRDWYWQKMSGNTYSEIQNDWEKNPKTHYKEECPISKDSKKRCPLCYVDEINDIIKAVSRYKKSLKSTFPV